MLGMNVENKQGDFSLVEAGGPIDLGLQFVSLPFTVLRNIGAWLDPDNKGEGTAVGNLMKEGGLMSVFGKDVGDGLLGLFPSDYSGMNGNQIDYRGYGDADSRNAPQPWGQQGDNIWSPDGINVFHGGGYNWNNPTPSSSTPSSSSTSNGGGWGSNTSASDMAHSEVGSYASYDDPDEF